MEVKTYGRLFRYVGYLACVLVGFLGLSAQAIDTSQCGFLACQAGVVSHTIAAGRCTDGRVAARFRCEGRANDAVDLKQSNLQSCTGPEAWSAFVTIETFQACNCAAQPPIPAGEAWSGGVSGNCVAGCKYIPETPSVCWGAPHPPGSAGGAKVCDGARKPDGSNCDPFAEEPGDPSNPTCNSDGDCLGGDSKSHPPKFCGTFNGKYMCVPADDGPCAGGRTEGWLCAGSPNAPKPPPPPDSKPGPPPANPDETGPPDHVAEGARCTGSNCVPVEITHYGGCPPEGCVQPHACPAGTHQGANGACVSDEGQCPDGSQPVNGECPAPNANCPDGTKPVNGKCEAPWANCPDGSKPRDGYCMPQQGLCADGKPPPDGHTCPASYAPCADGSQPVGGKCPPTLGRCPNGSQPVDGKCPVGSDCDPATDPNHCEGDDNHAGGGETCAAQPFCSGDEALCNILAQQWSTRCAVENLGKVTGEIPTGHEGESPGDTNVIKDVGADMLTRVSSTGFLGGGNCPRPPAFSAFGTSFDFAEVSWWCDLMTALSAIILFIGGVISMRILIEG